VRIEGRRRSGGRQAGRLVRIGKGRMDAGPRGRRLARCMGAWVHGCVVHGGKGEGSDAGRVHAVLWVIDCPGARIATHVARRFCSPLRPDTHYQSTKLFVRPAWSMSTSPTGSLDVRHSQKSNADPDH
jgi:hypothetical protein